MQRIALVCAAAAALTSCGTDRPDVAAGHETARADMAEGDGGGLAVGVRLDWTYELTHVVIVDEGGIGPEPRTMALALGGFRRALIADGLDNDAEAARWAALQEIRWTAEELDGGGTYDGAGSIRLTYPGCVTDSTLFAALLGHYEAEGLELETGETWAAELAEELGLCPSQT